MRPHLFSNPGCQGPDLAADALCEPYTIAAAEFGVRAGSGLPFRPPTTGASVEAGPDINVIPNQNEAVFLGGHSYLTN